MKKIKKLAVLFSLFITIFIPQLYACTGIFLKTTTNSYIYARTLEFGLDLQSKILFIPRNYQFIAAAPENKQGLEWKSNYAAIGTNAFGSTNFVDGVNEKGLAGGLFYFPGFAQYQEVAPEHYKQSLPMWQLLTWILTTFASVENVKEALPKIYVSKAKFPELPNLPLHLILHDTTGKSIVVEYINGTLHLHDNPLGIITNSPSFDWHMTNLRNYINLAPLNAKEKKINGVILSPFGQGSGMLGLPGDFTPPSRFVRAVAFSQAAPKVTTELDGIYQAFHILNNFDIPKGTVIDEKGNSDYTLWTSAIDMKHKIFYIRPYENFQLQKIDLMKMDLNAKTHRIFEINHKDEIIDIK